MGPGQGPAQITSASCVGEASGGDFSPPGGAAAGSIAPPFLECDPVDSRLRSPSPGLSPSFPFPGPLPLCVLPGTAWVTYGIADLPCLLHSLTSGGGAFFSFFEGQAAFWGGEEGWLGKSLRQLGQVPVCPCGQVCPLWDGLEEASGQIGGGDTVKSRAEAHGPLKKDFLFEGVSLPDLGSFPRSGG